MRPLKLCLSNEKRREEEAAVAAGQRVRCSNPNCGIEKEEGQNWGRAEDGVSTAAGPMLPAWLPGCLVLCPACMVLSQTPLHTRASSASITLY